MKIEFKIVKKLYRDNRPYFFVKYKKFLFWRRLPHVIEKNNEYYFKTNDTLNPFEPYYHYEIYDSFESAANQIKYAEKYFRNKYNNKTVKNYSKTVYNKTINLNY